MSLFQGCPLRGVPLSKNPTPSRSSLVQNRYVHTYIGWGGLVIKVIAKQAIINRLLKQTSKHKHLVFDAHLDRDPEQSYC